MVHKFWTRVDNHLNQAFESEARSLSMSVAAQKKIRTKIGIISEHRKNLGQPKMHFLGRNFKPRFCQIPGNVSEFYVLWPAWLNVTIFFHAMSGYCSLLAQSPVECFANLKA